MTSDNKVDFNLKVLDHYRKSSDEMYQDLGQTTWDHFHDYAKIVLNFDDQMVAWKKEKSGNDYRNTVKDLDNKRRLTHNNCLHDIDIMNRLAKSDNLPPFAVFKSSNYNRTDIGNAILEACAENVEQNVSKVKHAPTRTETVHNIADSYNFMLNYTKYPLVRDQKANKYHFIDLFTQKEADYQDVADYTKRRTNDPKKLKMLNKAYQLSKEKPVSFKPTKTKTLREPSRTKNLDFD